MISLPPLPLMTSCPPRPTMQSAFGVPFSVLLFELPTMTLRPEALQNATGSAGAAVNACAVVIVVGSSYAGEQPAASVPKSGAARRGGQQGTSLDPALPLECGPVRKISLR